MTKEKESIIENKELREQLASRVDVLEKVKKLFLIGETDYCTVKQVAEYYEVGEKAIQTILERHKNELISDGVCVKSKSEFLNLQHEELEINDGKTTIIFDNDIRFDVPNRGMRVFPRRSILRIGMLLTESKIATEIRTQLLNVEEKTSDEVKVQDINEEQSLALGVGMAYASGDPTAIMVAATKYMEYKNRHIQELEMHNKVLAGEILDWGDRAKLNSGVRKLATFIGMNFGSLWNLSYKELLYKRGISVKSRGDKPYINHIYEDEWSDVLQTFAALCEKSGTTISEMIPVGDGIVSE